MENKIKKNYWKIIVPSVLIVVFATILTILLIDKSNLETITVPHPSVQKVHIDTDTMKYTASYETLTPPVSSGRNSTKESISEPSNLSVFSPQDVSNSTISQIVTYNDYLKMYEKIINNYFSDAEEAYKGTILANSETFQTMKKQINDSFAQQKDIYDEMGKKRLIGQTELVEYLEDYRDKLKEYTNQLQADLNK